MDPNAADYDGHHSLEQLMEHYDNRVHRDNEGSGTNHERDGVLLLSQREADGSIIHHESMMPSTLQNCS